MAGEGVTHLDSGVPLVARRVDGAFTLANLLRAMLYSSAVTLKIGMELLEKENVQIDSIVGHGGYFKTPEVGQKYLAAALGTAVTCMKTAGEGGSYGMAVLAAYLPNNSQSLEDFLNIKVFKNAEKTTLYPDKETTDGFAKYVAEYKKLLAVEEKTVEVFGVTHR